MPTNSDPTGRLDPSFDTASQGDSKFARGLLNLALAAEDTQYGLGAALNNLPLAVQAMAQQLRPGTPTDPTITTT